MTVETWLALKEHMFWKLITITEMYFEINTICMAVCFSAPSQLVFIFIYIFILREMCIEAIIFIFLKSSGLALVRFNAYTQLKILKYSACQTFVKLSMFKFIQFFFICRN